MFKRLIQWLFKDTITGWIFLILSAGILFQIYLKYCIIGAHHGH